MNAELFLPFTFNNGLRVKNRVAMSALTNTQSLEDGSLGDDEYNWLLRQARGGFGLLLTCAVYIEPNAKAWQGQLGLYTDEQIPALRRLTTALSEEGSVNIMQIFHGGVRCPFALTGQQPMSASEFELNVPGFEKPRAMTKTDIAHTIEQFAATTRRAWQAGFHGVELHGANGYLITQFISTQTNTRTDEYGGSLANRARFVRELVRACKQQVPESFLIGIRMLAEGPGLDLDENVQIAQWLVEDGVDYISLSAIDARAGTQKYAHVKDKPAVSYFRLGLSPDFPLIAGGGIVTPDDASQVLTTGATFVTLGRVAIVSPNWVNLALESSLSPLMPPYTEDYVRSTGVSERFIQYLKQLPQGYMLK